MSREDNSLNQFSQKSSCYWNVTEFNAFAEMEKRFLRLLGLNLANGRGIEPEFFCV